MQNTHRRMRPSPVRRAPQEETRARYEDEEDEPITIMPKTSAEWALGVILLVFGGALWLAGSKYTLFGWAVGVNLFLSWLGLPLAAPMPDSWFVLLAIPLGVIYSRVETRVWTKRGGRVLRTPLFWLGWVVIVGTDVFSTWLGVRSVGADSWTITQQVAANGWIAFVWSLILTFIPEWMILGGVRFFRR